MKITGLEMDFNISIGELLIEGKELKDLKFDCKFGADGLDLSISEIEALLFSIMPYVNINEEDNYEEDDDDDIELDNLYLTPEIEKYMISKQGIIDELTTDDFISSTLLNYITEDIDLLSDEDVEYLIGENNTKEQLIECCKLDKICRMETLRKIANKFYNVEDNNTDCTNKLPGFSVAYTDVDTGKHLNNEDIINRMMKFITSNLHLLSDVDVKFLLGVTNKEELIKCCELNRVFRSKTLQLMFTKMDNQDKIYDDYIINENKKEYHNKIFLDTLENDINSSNKQINVNDIPNIKSIEASLETLNDDNSMTGLQTIMKLIISNLNLLSNEEIKIITGDCENSRDEIIKLCESNKSFRINTLKLITDKIRNNSTDLSLSSEVNEKIKLSEEYHKDITHEEKYEFLMNHMKDLFTNREIQDIRREAGYELLDIKQMTIGEHSVCTIADIQNREDITTLNKLYYIALERFNNK